ncbi:hypothetical protein DJ568_15355 [Mucilaginibacter hurinus]|uniref:Ricin B lectin domain-containing protein n=1 Tax=Mucilaginibacter hurinus TaxID=2201324 RepID=A0A367GKA5_9SPHI|nr:RICIN domain-containing protein [Mucilaginibacter hurinus]RCH53914.1 hypothetical protein DJ568_15355 [Mucilaginibacter hurinus]
MKTKPALLGAVAWCLLMLLQGCKKEEFKTPQNADSRLRPNNTRAIGDEMRGAIPSGSYQIVTDVSYNAGKQVLSVVRAGVREGDKIEQRDYFPGTGQEWVAQNMGGNEYVIVSTQSGLALQVPVTYAPGVQLELGKLNTGLANQRWVGKYLGNGVYQIRTKLNVNLGINVEADSAMNGARITLNNLNSRRSHFLLYRTAYRDMQATNFFKRRSGWVSGDGGFSIPLDNNKVLWTFGDSGLDTYRPSDNTVSCLFSVHNALILQDKDRWSAAAAPTIVDNASTDKSTFKIPGSKAFFWDGSGVQIKDTIYVACSGLEPSNAPDAWLGVKGLPNIYMFKMKYPEMTVAGYHKVQPEVGKFDFVIGLVKDEASGYVYAFGRKQIFLEFSIHVARFPISNPNARWTFWDGSKWGDDINKSATIGVGDSPGTTVFRVRNKYVALSTEITFDCDDGKRIFASYSNSPTGPFTQRKAVYTIPDRYKGHTPLFYTPAGHGEYLNERNEVLITYSLNGYAPCVPNCSGPRSIRDNFTVQAARIPMKMIDPTF